MSETIFRKSAVERLSTPDQLDQAMSATAPLERLAVHVLLGLLAAALVWSVIASIPIKVSGQGILLGPGGVLDVTSASSGRIASIVAKPGDQVEAGQVVAYLEQPDIKVSLDAVRDELREKRDQFQKIAEFNQRAMQLRAELSAQKRAALNQNIASLEERLKWLRERERFETELSDKKIIARQRPIDTRIEINTALDAMASSRNEIRQLEFQDKTVKIEKENQLLDLELQISDIVRRERSLLEKLNRDSVVASPYSGRVAELKLNAGEMVDRNQSLMTVLPARAGQAPETQDDLMAVIYVPPSEGKKIRPGMEARIAPSVVKREEYGYILGRVRQVAAIPSTEEGLLRTLKNRDLARKITGGGAPFEIVVELARDADTPSGYRWSSSQGPNTQINSGTLADADVTVRSMRLITVVIPALQPLLEDDQAY